MHLASTRSHMAHTYSEVVLPALWNLQKLPNVTIDLFRDHFRPGAREALSGWFTGRQFKFDELVKQEMSEYDTIFLTTGDRATALLLDTNILAKHPHLRVVSIVHRSHFYGPEHLAASPRERDDNHKLAESDIAKIRTMIWERRWSFLCLSPHVVDHFLESFSSNFDSIIPWPIIRTFVPVSHANFNTIR